MRGGQLHTPSRPRRPINPHRSPPSSSQLSHLSSSLPAAIIPGAVAVAANSIAVLPPSAASGLLCCTISRACASFPPTGRTPSLPLDLPLPPASPLLLLLLRFVPLSVLGIPINIPSRRTTYKDLARPDHRPIPITRNTSFFLCCGQLPTRVASGSIHSRRRLFRPAPPPHPPLSRAELPLIPPPPPPQTTTTMLSQRAARAAATGAAARRTFSTTLAQRKHTPSLGDIEPEQHERFNARQREFREKLAEAQKQREASAFSSSPNGSSYIRSAAGQGLGSLSTAPVAGNQAAAADKEGAGRKAGPLANLIYGTKEGREMDAQIEASFSQVLARGKYVHSIVFHKVKPECVEEYVDLVGTWYPRMANKAENKVHLVGSWRTEVGDCDTFGMSPQPSPHIPSTDTPSPVHIWEYQRYQGYHASLHAIAHHPEYPEFDKKLRSLINEKNSSLMQEFSFWPTTSPRNFGGLFELRSYTLHPGNLLEWETHWRRGLAARREVMEGVGAWFVQIGDLNTVHHLWQFADLEERKIRREKSWGIEGWADTVHKTVPLIQEMKSRILIAMPWSPVA